MRPTTSLAGLLFLSLLGCAPAPAPGGPVDDPLPFDDGKGDSAARAFCVKPGSLEENGVLALVNDPAIDAERFNRPASAGGVGLDSRAAEAIFAARPLLTAAELDALPYVGPSACAALTRFACAEGGRCVAAFSALTWNLKHFPLSDRADDILADTLARLAPDVVAAQEVIDPAAFSALAARAGYQGILAEPGPDTRVAALVRPGTEILATESLFVDDGYAFPRPPLHLTLRLAGQHEIEVLVVHLKAQVDFASVKRRRAAITQLRAWLAAATRPAVVLGDWNDQLNDPAKDNIFLPLVADGNVFLTQPLADAGAFSYPAFRSLIDHILVTASAEDALHPYLTGVLPLDQTEEGYLTDMSDHLPVLARFTPGP